MQTRPYGARGLSEWLDEDGNNVKCSQKFPNEGISWEWLSIPTVESQICRLNDKEH